MVEKNIPLHKKRQSLTALFFRPYVMFSSPEFCNLPLIVIMEILFLHISQSSRLHQINGNR